jgi:rhamnan synthesis protein F
MTEPNLLTDLHRTRPGLRRILHGYATSGTRRRLLDRYRVVCKEILAAPPEDLAAWAGSVPATIRRIEPGTDPAPEATRVALYAHYTASGHISEMVRCQVQALREAGFAVTFISASPAIPEDDWQEMRRLCALLIQRRNFGLDFGAWHDAVPEIRRRWPALRELMLANDSVIGPVYPMRPVVDALRSGGNGLFGLTESLQGGPHLQSYMLLARGRAAVADVLYFLETVFVSHSKWLLVQMTELRLARWMCRRGHRVAALYGYDRTVRAALDEPKERAHMAALMLAAGRKLHDWPLNPTQHLWHVLVTRFNAPFIKTDLIRCNPGRLPAIANWAAVVPPDSPCPLAVLERHLETMRDRTKPDG